MSEHRSQWTLHQHGDTSGRSYIEDGEEIVIAIDLDPSTAEFIVKAVNCHDALADALEEILDALGALSNPSELYALVGEKSKDILSALARARSKP